jgi:exodeoxyribonuclease VII large subunit
MEHVLNILTVAQLNGYLKELFEIDPILQSIWLHGEVSNRTLSSAGHLYFTLKDGAAQIRCVAFKGQISRTNLLIPDNGDAIFAHGRISIYEAQGAYQLYVDVIQPEGTGALHLQFEELRARLEAEGLFETARKRPLPSFPKRIGVVTSPTGAAIRDIISILGRRYPLGELIVAPATVQGDGAAESVCQGIAALNDWADVDVIIVARGGGSLEELWAFNEEPVARAIYASRIPIVSGVGHETDVTIADLVADLRAPTPSAAAELISPDLQDYQAQVETWNNELADLVNDQIEAFRYQTSTLEARLYRSSPSRNLALSRQRVDDYARLAASALSNQLRLYRERVNGQELRLGSLSPLAVLQRGYSICWNERTGQIVSTVNQANSGDALRIRVSDGSFEANVD